jgi:hypothetical protein
MPELDLTDDELAAVMALVRRTVDADKFPLSPRLAPLRSALAKLDPRPAKPRRELPPLPSGPMVGSRRKARRWEIAILTAFYAAEGGPLAHLHSLSTPTSEPR